MNVEVIYLNFAKAFDKVNHAILWEKIKGMGIDGKLHLWLNSYLTGREQQVTVRGTLSTPELILSGTPQGSVGAHYY